MKSDVTIAIPNTGRMAVESLEWLADLGIVNKQWQEKAVRAMSIKNAGEWQVQQYLSEMWKDPSNQGLTKKYDLRSGWRVAFAEKQIVVPGTSFFGSIYGSEKPTTQVITQGIGDIAIIGFDELLSAFIPYLAENEKSVRTWDEFNIALRPFSTDVRYKGVTGMDDYAGLFLFARQDKKIFLPSYLEEIRRGEIKVAVKGEYEGLMRYLLGAEQYRSGNIFAWPTQDVEAEVAKGAFGFDVVRTGATILKNNFKIAGEALLYTKSVVVADKGTYITTDGVAQAVNSLTQKPYSTASLERWKRRLESTLSQRWER